MKYNKFIALSLKKRNIEFTHLLYQLKNKYAKIRIWSKQKLHCIENYIPNMQKKFVIDRIICLLVNTRAKL